jgi:hypothetical protein
MLKRILITLTITLLPSMALAAPKTFKELMDLFIRYIKLVTPLVFGLAILAFMWGVMTFIFAAGNEDKRSEGKNIMLWGLIAIFFLTSILAIVSLVGGTIFPEFDKVQVGQPNGNSPVQFIDNIMLD